MQLSMGTDTHQQLAQDGAGLGSVGSEYGLVSMQASPALERAAELVALAVNARLQSGGAAMLPLEAADRQAWRPNCAVANCYASGAVGMAAHSDRMTALGPCPIIASLSLGATRCFRLHRTQRVDLWEGAGGTGSGSPHDTAVAAGADVVRVDLQLAHNQLLVMWPPTQETWKHEVRGSAVEVGGVGWGGGQLELLQRRLCSHSRVAAWVLLCGFVPGRSPRQASPSRCTSGAARPASTSPSAA